MKKLTISLLILIVIVLGAISMFNKQTAPVKDDGKLNITASIYPIYDFTKEVAGDKANVKMLLSPGVDVHDYEPTPQDIISIEESDLFFYLGKDLEPWGDTITSGVSDKSNIKEIASGIQLIENEEFENEYFSGDDHEEESEHEKYDTHIWLDPTKSIELVKNIAKELSAKDPENADYYNSNAEKYIEKLEKLDSEIESTIKNSRQSEIAFGGPFSYAYFIKRYNLKFVTAYDSCGENGEPSVDKIFKVIEEIKQNNIPVVFYKELSSGNIVKTISEETGSKMLEFNSVHTVTQKQLEDGATYLSIMYQNLENIKQALPSK